VQNTRVHAVAWWASANLLRAVSVDALRPLWLGPRSRFHRPSNVILFSSFGVTWNGARVFNGREALPGSLIAGAGIWLLASQCRGLRRARRSAASSRR